MKDNPDTKKTSTDEVCTGHKRRARFSALVHNGPSSLLYNGYRVTPGPGVNRSRRGVALTTHPPPLGLHSLFYEELFTFYLRK